MMIVQPIAYTVAALGMLLSFYLLGNAPIF